MRLICPELSLLRLLHLQAMMHVQNVSYSTQESCPWMQERESDASTSCNCHSRHQIASNCLQIPCESNETHAGHFILEMEAAAAGRKNGSRLLQQKTQLSQRAGDLGPPLFNMTGLAIGNGLTDPATQARPFALILRQRQAERVLKT